MGFLSDLFGGSARKDLRNARKASNAELDAGYAGATDFYNQGYDVLTPYAEGGKAGFDAYNQAIGLGTPEQQAAVQARYLNDPMQQAQLGQASNALLRNLNARGAGQGVQALAANRVATENYGGWLNRLQGVGQQGGQMATNQSNIRLGQGDMRFGLGATKAGSEINFGNAMSQSRNIGINNLLGIVNAGAKAYSSFSGGK